MLVLLWSEEDELVLWYWWMYHTGIVLVHGTDTAALWYWYMLALLWSVEDNLPLAVSLWLLRLFCDINRTYCGVSYLKVILVCVFGYLLSILLLLYFKHLNQVWYFTFQNQYFDFLSCETFLYNCALLPQTLMVVVFCDLQWPDQPAPLWQWSLSTPNRRTAGPPCCSVTLHI